jgi:hypothetical protein
MVPYTRDVFLAVLERYNGAIWPAQAVAWALGAVLVLLVLRPRPGGDRLVCAVLAVSWLWIGVVYNGLHYATINWAAWVFGGVCLFQGVLLVWSGVIGGRLGFRFGDGLHAWAGLGLMAYALAGHPLLERLTGQAWSQVQVFGVAPGPTTIFTFGILVLAARRTPLHLMAVPLLWSLVGGARAWLAGIPADLALPVAGALALGLVIQRNRQIVRQGTRYG